ncbi:MAG: acetyltransferase [Flavobacteriaceae bacterium]|nr:acetyltransferase [Flavobacteriaceae bacterium]
MKNIIIIGCGSHASEIVEYIEYINKQPDLEMLNIVGLLDENTINYHHYNYQYQYLGEITAHDINPQVYYIMGIGNLCIRTKVFEEFKAKEARFTGIVHPTALVSASAKIGEGTIISHNVSVGPKAIVGKFNVINSRCTIGHDVTIGNNNFLSPQVVLGGYAKMGNSNFLGTNSCLLPQIEIENNNTIMAGMTITSKVNNDETVFFRYKEKLTVKQ